MRLTLRCRTQFDGFPKWTLDFHPQLLQLPCTYCCCNAALAALLTAILELGSTVNCLMTSSLNLKKENIPDSNQGNDKLLGSAIEILEVTQANL